MLTETPVCACVIETYRAAGIRPPRETSPGLLRPLRIPHKIRPAAERTRYRKACPRTARNQSWYRRAFLATMLVEPRTTEPQSVAVRRLRSAAQQLEPGYRTHRNVRQTNSLN